MESVQRVKEIVAEFRSREDAIGGTEAVDELAVALASAEARYQALEARVLAMVQPVDRFGVYAPGVTVPATAGVKRFDETLVDAIPKPKIICLCGSTRFIDLFAVYTWELERAGHIVLGCTLLPAWYCKVPSHFGEATGTKAQCDELHLRKIDLADEVLVLNAAGYIGESTRNEISYAHQHGKRVHYLEGDADPLPGLTPSATMLEGSFNGWAKPSV